MASLQRILKPAGRQLLAASCKRSAPAPCAALATQNGSSVASKFLSSSAPRLASSGSPPPPAADAIPDGELEVGELQGAKFRIEPLRRVGESPDTMRARLLRQSRGRGTLESELLMSTFAKAHLPSMTPAQLEQYDRFLDENDWDIYYWATQGEAPPAVADSSPSTTSDQPAPSPRPGEWAQTVGTFKPAYRPVPSRWKDSEVLALLRQHVKDRSAGGKSSVGGMAFMPPLSG